MVFELNDITATIDLYQIHVKFNTLITETFISFIPTLFILSYQYFR